MRGGERMNVVTGPVTGGTRDQPFNAMPLAALYPTHQDYVDAVSESADAAVAAGFLLQADADDIVAAAEDADIP